MMLGHMYRFKPTPNQISGLVNRTSVSPIHLISSNSATIKDTGIVEKREAVETKNSFARVKVALELRGHFAFSQ